MKKKWREGRFSGGTSGKELACQCRRLKRCEIYAWVRKIPREWNGKPLQYSCLKDPMDRGAWWATVHRVIKSQTRWKWLHRHVKKKVQTVKGMCYHEFSLIVRCHWRLQKFLGNQPGWRVCVKNKTEKCQNLSEEWNRCQCGSHYFCFPYYRSSGVAIWLKGILQHRDISWYFISVRSTLLLTILYGFRNSRGKVPPSHLCVIALR